MADSNFVVREAVGCGLGLFAAVPIEASTFFVDHT